MGERLVRWRAEERRQLWIAFGVTLAAALLLDTFVLPRAAAAWTALAPAPAETASSHDDAGQALRPPSNPEHTAAPSQPPARIGPDYDDDRHLARRARPVASYDLAARLDAERHTVTGKGTIRWTNASSEPATELYWHLYLNAFKNERTLFLRSPFGAGRTAQRAADWGYTKIERLVAAGADLLPRLAQHSPGDPDDQTSLRLELPAPVPPGETLELSVEFESKLPSIVERTGYSRDYHLVAQWFPKIARREADGTWAHFPFHPQAEFYADYGDYRITLDVPAEMVVGATGRRVDEKRHGARKVLRYEIGDVHDFAWTAWPGFLELREQVDGVELRLLFPAGHETSARTSLESIRFALPFFSRRFGRYPYPMLTVVHPPEHAAPSGGMEYPTLITTGGPWYAPLLGVRALETVTVHELAHQWFYGLVASNEAAYPFLDEGLTSYAESLAMSQLYGPGSLFDGHSFEVSEAAVRRAVAAAYAGAGRIGAPAAHFADFQELGALVYARTATVLETIGNVYGQQKLLTALGRYARRYRFEHPGPKHLLAAVREVFDDHVADTLERALFEPAAVDFSVDEVRSVPYREPSGIFDGERSTRPAATPPRFVGRVLVRRRGDLRFPVEIDLFTERGDRLRRRWDGRGTFTTLDYEGDDRLVGALVDPERRITLDHDLTNNAFRSSPESGGRILERSVYAAYLLLAVAGP